MRKIIILLLAICLINLTSAEFNISSSNIQTEVSEGETIKGKIKISLNEESTRSLITSNFEGETRLIDFIEANLLIENEDFTCTNSDCKDSLAYENSINTFNIDESNEKTIGIVLEGTDIKIDSINFRVQSPTESSSCLRQIAIDFLDNNQELVTHSRYVDQTCTAEDYGCFEDTNTNLAEIQDTVEYCEKITLPPAPAYKIGAAVRNATEGDSRLIARLYESSGSLLGSCFLPEHSTLQLFEKLSCLINYTSAESNDYFVCINAETDSNFQIKTETKDPKCGNTAPGSDVFARDYEIFAQSMQFGPVNFEITNENFNEDLKNLNNYLIENYNSSCSPSCILPIRFLGQENQQIDLSNIDIKFQDAGALLSTTQLFDLTVEPSKITSEVIELDVEKIGIQVPIGSSSDKFELFLNGAKILEENITIKESFDFDIAPKFVAFGQEAIFSAITAENISSSSWDFGDSFTTTSNSNQAQHQYLQQGEFTIKVELTSSDGIKSKREFLVLVGDARLIANTTIASYKARIGAAKQDIEEIPDWAQVYVSNESGLNIVEQELNSLEQQYYASQSDEDFQKVMVSLLSLNIPNNIGTGKKGEFPLLIGFDNFETVYIEELSGRSADDKEGLKAKISSWMIENFDSKLNFEQVFAFYDGNTELLFSRYTITTNPKNSFGEAFLIIPYGLEGIVFRQDYGAKAIPGVGGTYIALDELEPNQAFDFIIFDDVNPSLLGSYISPEISFLGGQFGVVFDVCNYNSICEESIGENTSNCREDCKPIGLASIWYIVLIITFFTIYLILQEWYKKHYQNSLFKKEHNLYNLINYIYNGRRAGAKDEQLKKKLIRAGWKREKIRYVFRKIDGKRTGMYEIPIFKFVENRQVKKEIKKRQKGSIDTRFIKRRRF